MHSYLQTKAVSLALEAKYIRFQENKFKKLAKKYAHVGPTATWAEKNREGQYLHRMGIVREEARITNIARAFLRGHAYADVERGARHRPNWNRVLELILQYGERESLNWRAFSNQSFDEAVNDWLSAARAYYHANHIKPNPPKEEKVSFSA